MTLAAHRDRYNQKAGDKAIPPEVIDKIVMAPQLFRRLVNLDYTESDYAKSSINPWYNEMISQNIKPKDVVLAKKYIKFCSAEDLRLKKELEAAQKL